MFHQSQLFKLHKDVNSETMFALYTSVADREGQVYYLKPGSGDVVAEKSGTPDGYHYFSLSEASVNDTVSICKLNGNSLTGLNNQ